MLCLSFAFLSSLSLYFAQPVFTPAQRHTSPLQASYPLQIKSQIVHKSNDPQLPSALPPLFAAQWKPFSGRVLQRNKIPLVSPHIWRVLNAGA